jgi:CBS domain-containing protein
MSTSGHHLAPHDLVDELDSVDRLEPLGGYRHAVLRLIQGRLGDGGDVLDVSSAVADANDLLVARLIALAEDHLGVPPVRYRWLALGSHGRREQVLSSDQDHAIAYETPAPDLQPAAHDYFTSLAGLVVPALARAGLPLCAGGYMATRWCRPLADYEQMFRGWVEEPRPQSLLQAEVFLDTRPASGDLPVDVLDRILRGGGTRGPFRAQLARAAVLFRPPLGWFGRIRRTGDAVDVKIGGTAAIVLLARLYALAAGSDEHSTVPRIRSASAAGALGRPGAESLEQAYRFLTDLRMRHQVSQVAAGRPADNLLPVASLTDGQRRRLTETLRLVRDLQDVTAMRFATSSMM